VATTVISDSSGSRLSVVSGTSGAAGQVTITSSLSDATTGNSIAFHSSQAGKDASLTVDNVPITSSSNTVSNAIPGVTFQLLASDPNTPVQIQITNGNTDVEKAVESLVSAYNAVVTDLNAQTGKDSSGNAEPLSGTATLAQLQNQLSGALFAGSASGSIKGLSQLGISLNNDGTLALDGNVLDSALNTNFSDVTGFFQNSGSFGQTFAATLNNLSTQAPDGVIFLAQQQNTAQEAVLNTDITNQNALLATQKTQLTAELNMANQILQSIPSQLNEINSVFDASMGFNPNQN
jgi:flagellar hook-associated protein 2